MPASVLQLQPEEQTLRKLTIAEYHKLVGAGFFTRKKALNSSTAYSSKWPPSVHATSPSLISSPRNSVPRAKADTKSALEDQFRFPISTNRSPTWCSSREACPARDIPRWSGNSSFYRILNMLPENGRAGGIRTHDLLNPIQAHYQAVLRPDAKEAQDAAPKWYFQAGKHPGITSYCGS
jgi:hypothetical protein